MPFKDPEKQAKFQNEWMKKRRLDWIAQNGPCACGSADGLRVVHVNPDTRKTSQVWSWSEERRNAELAKCKAMCRECRIKHWGKIFRDAYKGRRGLAEKLTPETVWAIRGRLLGREGIREIARAYHLDHSAIIDIQRGRIWSWLKGGRRKVFGIDKTKALK